MRQRARAAAAREIYTYVFEDGTASAAEVERYADEKASDTRAVLTCLPSGGARGGGRSHQRMLRRRRDMR